MKFDSVLAVRSSKTVYREGDRCVKVFDEGYSKQDVLNEALNHARVEATGLNIPELLEVTTVDGKWAIVTRFIEGKTLTQLMAENPDDKDKYIDLLVNLQIQIHERTCPLLNKLKDSMGRKLCLTELAATTRFDLYTRLDAMPRHSKICHGDFHPSNVIIAEDGTPYIIDWSHATQGNASSDAAGTYLSFRILGDKAGAEKYLELFCEKSKTDKQYVFKWIPIVAAAKSISSDEDVKEQLLYWVDSTDFE